MGMERLYKLYKGKVIKYPDCEGILCGYTEDNLLMATEDKSQASFRKFGKESQFVEEEFKDGKYRYLYVSEKTVEEQHKKKGRKICDYPEKD